MSKSYSSLAEQSDSSQRITFHWIESPCLYVLESQHQITLHPQAQTSCGSWEVGPCTLQGELLSYAWVHWAKFVASFQSLLGSQSLKEGGILLRSSPYFLFHTGSWDQNWNSNRRITAAFQSSQWKRRNTKNNFLESGHDIHLTGWQQR